MNLIQDTYLNYRYYFIVYNNHLTLYNIIRLISYQIFKRLNIFIILS